MTSLEVRKQPLFLYRYICSHSHGGWSKAHRTKRRPKCKHKEPSTYISDFVHSWTQNQALTHDKFNGLTFTHILRIICKRNAPHVEAGSRNNLLQLSDRLDFEYTETPENRILNFLRHFSYHLLLIKVTTTKNPVCWTVRNTHTKLHYVVLHMCVTHNRLSWTV